MTGIAGLLNIDTEIAYKFDIERDWDGTWYARVIWLGDDFDDIKVHSGDFNTAIRAAIDDALSRKPDELRDFR